MKHQLSTQKNLNNSLRTLEIQESVDDIKISLAMVMERLNMEFKNINMTATDIHQEFKYATLLQIREALRLGSLGNYGRTYKLSTQEVCVWIRSYLNDKKPKMI